MSDLVLRPFLRRWWAAVVLGGLLLGPTTADAQSPVATVVIYEVAEALRFKGPKAATSPTELRRRLAEATLLGKDVQGREGTVFSGAQFIIVDAQSNVDLSTGVGPIRGTFDLLIDTDPARESLDTLVITGSGSLRGTLDLTTAQQGYAGVHGRWEARRARARGTFNGVFLIPFLVVDTYYYLDLGLVPCASGGAMLPIGPAPVPVCPLRPDEFSLGIPLTKAVIFLHSD
ncbi:MAG TPA: hypothetical protein VNO23_06940 [Candidatus Binatia bacterium]|nr:hypothetical protein [Candidatus Binatia bacterium]